MGVGDYSETVVIVAGGNSVWDTGTMADVVVQGDKVLQLELAYIKNCGMHFYRGITVASETTMVGTGF